MSSSDESQPKPSEIKMNKQRTHKNSNSRTDHDVTGNEEAELQIHTDQSKIAIKHQQTPSSSDDKDSDDSNKVFDSKEDLAFPGGLGDDKTSSDDGSDEVPSTQQVSQITQQASNRDKVGKKSIVSQGAAESSESSRSKKSSQKEWTARNNHYTGTDVSVSKDKRMSKGFKAGSMFKSKEERNKQLQESVNSRLKMFGVDGSQQAAGSTLRSGDKGGHFGSTGQFVDKEGKKKRPSKNSQSDSSSPSSGSGGRKSKDKRFSSALSSEPGARKTAAKRMASGLHSSKNASLKSIAEQSQKGKAVHKSKTKDARSSGSGSSSKSQSPTSGRATGQGKGKNVAKSQTFSKTGSSMSKTESKTGRATETSNSDTARSSKRRQSILDLDKKGTITSKGAGPGGSRASSRTSSASSRESKGLKPGDIKDLAAKAQRRVSKLVDAAVRPESFVIQKHARKAQQELQNQLAAQKPDPESLRRELFDFRAGLEFDFSKRRSQKRRNHLTRLGISADLYAPSSGDNDKYLREEGVEEDKMARIVKRQFSQTHDLQALIDEFKSDEFMEGELTADPNIRLLGAQNKLSTADLKKILKKQLSKRNSQVKKLNRKSRVFIGDSFLKFHLVQNLLFYLVLFTVPSMSVIDCIMGHSVLSYVAIACFMASVFIVDFINLRYHIKKELLKLELKNFYGDKVERQYFMELAVIYGQAACEIFLTQLNLFDLYTDFAFMTIAYSEKELNILFILSMTSFTLTMIPKVLSFYIIFKVLYSPKKKYKRDPVLNKNQQASSAYDDDFRRKMIFRAFTFSEFRSQALCVDYIKYEIYKTEFLMSALKFGIEDLPQFLIQAYYLLNTNCGVQNANVIVYLSVFSSVLSSYSGFLFRLTIYLYKRKRLHAQKDKVEVVVGNTAIENYGFKHIQRMMPEANDLQSLKLSGTNTEYFNCNEKRLHKIEAMMKVLPKRRTQFFEINRCNFEYPYEPQILFNFLMNPNIFKNIRYVTIQRCKLCQGFSMPALTSLLNEDENMVRFSLVLNNQSSLVDEDEEAPSKKMRKRSAGSMVSSSTEKQLAQQSGFKTDFEILQILDAATLHPTLEIIQIAQCLQDYFEAFEYTQMKRHQKSPEDGSFARLQNEHLEFQEEERRSNQLLLFEQNKEERLTIYESIHANLIITSSFSSLRRLEIRYLPLDPIFVKILFSALHMNYVLQELILTDDALQYCDTAVFQELCAVLRDNKASALCMLDFSRNIHAFDDALKTHKALIEALKEQKTGTMATDAEHHGLEVEGYIETVKFTSSNNAVLKLYEDLVTSGGQAGKKKQKAKAKQIEHLVIIVNDQNILGANARGGIGEAGAEESEHALDAVRNREAELDDVELPDAYQSDEDER